MTLGSVSVVLSEVFHPFGFQRLFTIARLSASMTLADFARLVLTTLLWLPLPYCAALLSQAFVVEPLSFLPAGYGLTLLLWLVHKISPAVDVVRAFGVASPVLTHRLPLSQLATAVLMAVLLLFVAVWAVQRREY